MLSVQNCFPCPMTGFLIKRLSPLFLQAHFNYGRVVTRQNLLFSRTKNPNILKLFLIGEVFDSSICLCSSSLDVLQHVHVFPLGNPELNMVYKVGCHGDRENHFLLSSGHTSFHAPQDKIGFLSWKLIAGSYSVFYPSALSSSYQQDCFQSIHASVCTDIWGLPRPRWKILHLALLNFRRFTRMHS